MKNQVWGPAAIYTQGSWGRFLHPVIQGQSAPPQRHHWAGDVNCIVSITQRVPVGYRLAA
jgi:hypothetical protein